MQLIVKFLYWIRTGQKFSEILCFIWLAFFLKLFSGGLILNTSNEFEKNILKDIYFKSIHLLLKVFWGVGGLLCSDTAPAELVKKLSCFFHYLRKLKTSVPMRSSLNLKLQHPTKSFRAGTSNPQGVVADEVPGQQHVTNCKPSPRAWEAMWHHTGCKENH